MDDPTSVIEAIVSSGCVPDRKAHQLYRTEAELASIAFAMVEPEPGCTFLEPSAGDGGLADLLPSDRTTWVEIAPVLCQVLRAKGYRVEQADFLTWAEKMLAEGRRWDRIVMNPPFACVFRRT